MVFPQDGTLTFLFTDIENSMNLAQQYPEAMPSLLERHHLILSEAIVAHRGQIFRIIGDAFCAAFPVAADALGAALEAQRKLQQETWTPPAVRVRMGLHSGAASPGDLDPSNHSGNQTGYLTLARAQRIMAAASGGQILLSSASAELVRSLLPQDVALRDMGEHRLKGLAQPEHLWQIVAPGLIAKFPPLKTASVLPGNLPLALTSFIGRVREISEIEELLKETHLVTLTGPGGTGKTRLSLRVAASVQERYEDGVWFADLASLADPSLVPQVAAMALGAREQPGRPMTAQLVEYLRSKKLLLVLDNCEHLVDACAQLAEALLLVCPDLRLLATSREALGIAGETVYPVPPLQIPVTNGNENPSQLLQYESVRLFVERARAVQPHFALGEANAEAVAQICRRLDGIPLALELAAVRIRLFTPEQIAQRLDDRFRLLTGGSRTALPRQQTLRALIEWSYDLLSEPECDLLRRLSVFAGGWTFDAAEYVCGQADDPGSPAPPGGEAVPAFDLLDGLAQLVNKSLVVADEQGSETRYRFLETIRQFAHDKLLESGEAGRVRQRHLDYYLALAERAEPEMHGAAQVLWLDTLDIEEDNFRTAQNWALESGQVDRALQLAGALWWFWYIRDHTSEAQKSMQAALALSEASEPDEKRLKVMIGLAFILYAASDMARSRALLTEAASLSQKLGNTRRQAEAVQYLGAVELVEATRFMPADFTKVRQLLNQSLELWRALDDQTGISWGLNQMASVEQAEGNLPQARKLWEESVRLRRAVGDPFLLAYSLRRLADITLEQGDFTAAEAGYREAHLLLVEVRGKAGMTASLAGFAGLALAQAQTVRAVRLLGAVHAILQDLAWHLPPADDEVYERNVARARLQLGEAAFQAAWKEGEALSLDQAIAYALGYEEAF